MRVHRSRYLSDNYAARGALNRPRIRPRLFSALFCCLLATPLQAGQALVATATNFVAVARELADRYAGNSGDTVTIVSGSTGLLYAQIVQGAPYDILLAADQDRPRRLATEGRADTDSIFTYAGGRLILWSRDPDRIGIDGPQALRGDDFRKLAIANPKLAPYGAAAQEVLVHMKLWERLAGRIVLGENIGQAYALVASGNAELGLVAASADVRGSGSHWEIPAALHAPIRQDAILLRRAANNVTAIGFLRYLRSADAKSVIARHGFRVD